MAQEQAQYTKNSNEWIADYLIMLKKKEKYINNLEWLLEHVKAGTLSYGFNTSKHHIKDYQFIDLIKKEIERERREYEKWAGELETGVVKQRKTVWVS